MNTATTLSAIQLMTQEFRDEAAAAKRILDRVPADKLTWKPHPKSMSLGQLSLHIARIPNLISRLLKSDHFDVSQASFSSPDPANLEEIPVAFTESVRAAEAYFSGLTEDSATEHWRMMMKEKELSSRPKIAVIRTMLLNHWYHHRGQLSVYLRLLDVPVPVIYGRSADEGPYS